MNKVSQFNEKMNGRAFKNRQTRITEWCDESDKTIWYICTEHDFSGKVIGDAFYTKYLESVEAWLRLVKGTYSKVG